MPQPGLCLPGGTPTHLYRYSEWDGSQELELPDPEELLRELSDDLLNHGDLTSALRWLLQRGLSGRRGAPIPGLQELLRQLRSHRQQRLDQHDLGSVLDDIQRRLDQIIQREREGIQQRLQEARQPAAPEAEVSAEREALRRTLEQLAAKRLSTLDKLPPDPAGRLRELSQYDFLDPEARRQFQELLQMLQQRMLDSVFRDLSQHLQSLRGEDLSRLRQMLQDLNQLLAQRMRGAAPDFDQFLEKYGQYFPGVSSLDELAEQLQRQIAQMQSLFDSLAPEQRRALRQLMDSLLQDRGLQEELALLAMNLEHLLPLRQFRNRYPFRGDDPLTLTEAMRLMEQLQQMDDLERQLRGAEQSLDLEEIDREKLERFLGEEAARTLETLKKLAESLEKAGYVRREGNRLELTPKGTRQLGQKALEEIFSRLRKEGFGKHPTPFRGLGGERAEDLKAYEFGDPLDLHLERTLMNSLVREPSVPPLKLVLQDFQIYTTQHLTQTHTVLILDLSWSMAMRGSFYAAKKVALALNNLIRTQFPKDTLYVVGFAGYAREFTIEELTRAAAGDYARGTNIQHALMVAQKLLGKRSTANKQVILVTDGQPTAHLEGGRAFVSFPATLKTLQLTLQEAKHCHRQGIVINTFMMDDDYYLRQFVHQLTRVNRGRVFFTSPENLGKYVLVDYLAHKRRCIG